MICLDYSNIMNDISNNVTVTVISLKLVSTSARYNAHRNRLPQ